MIWANLLSPARETEAQRGAGECLKLLSSAPVAVSLCPESCLPASKDSSLTCLPSTVLGGQDSFLCPLMSRGHSFPPSPTSWYVFVSCRPRIP